MTPVRKHRRNFLSAFTAGVLLWLILALIIFKVDPEKSIFLTIYDLRFTIHENIILFFITFTLSLTLTLALLFGNTRRGFFLSLLADAFLFLSLIKQGNLLNFFLLIAIWLTLEICFSSRRKPRL